MRAPFVGLGLLLGLMLSAPVRAADPAASAKPNRTLAEAEEAIKTATAELGAGVAGLGQEDVANLFRQVAKDPALRPQKIAALKHRLAACDAALRFAPPAPNATRFYRWVYDRALLAYFQDPDTLHFLETTSKGEGMDAVDAQATLALADWWTHSTAPAPQTKVLETMRSLARTAPLDDTLHGVLWLMQHSNTAATPALAAAAEEIVLRELQTPGAVRLRNQPRRGSPLDLTGTTTTGEPFSLATLKGRVVIVHFWSPAVPANRVLLPFYAKLNQALKDKGASLVGVVSADTSQQLAKFLTDNKDYNWTQLFDLKNPKAHPLLAQFSLTNNATVLLVGRDGNVAEITDVEHIEELLPKLLAAPVPPPK